MRPISSTSRKPRVVTRPTAPTRRSTIALVTSVVPWASEAQWPTALATAARPFSTPPAGLAGVVGTLSELMRPAASHATRSVKVPPTSTPTRTPEAVMRSRTAPGSRPAKSRSTVLARLQPADLAPVHLVGPVGEAERPRVSPHGGQREFLAHAAAAVELHGALDDRERHVGHRYLDLGDGLLGSLVADGVHHVRRVQHQEPCLVDLDARLGDALERDVVLGQALAERHAVLRALAHELERPFGDADLAHAVVDAARAEAALGDLEAAPFTQEDVRRRHPDVLEKDFAVAVGRVVVAEYRQHAEHLDARRVARHQDHRLLLVAVGVLRVGLTHEDEDLATRVADARAPPLVAVDHVGVALADDRRLDVGRIGRRDLRLGHDERRADLALEQRLEPLLLLCLGAVALDRLHVAGIRRRAVERLGSDGRAAHDLAERRVLEVGEPRAALALRQEEIPEAALARIGLQLFHDRRDLPSRGRRFELVVEDLLVRIDVLGHEVLELLHVHLGLLRVLEFHRPLPYLAQCWYRGSVLSGEKNTGRPIRPTGTSMSTGRSIWIASATSLPTSAGSFARRPTAP